MLPPRIRAARLEVVSADSPEELCSKVNEKLDTLDLQGLPTYCEKCGKWLQYLTEITIVIPKAMMAEESNIVPVKGNLVSR